MTVVIAVMLVIPHEDILLEVKVKARIANLTIVVMRVGDHHGVDGCLAIWTRAVLKANGIADIDGAQIAVIYRPLLAAAGDVNAFVGHGPKVEPPDIKSQGLLRP